MVQTDTLQYQCKGVIYYFLSTLLLALTFFCYIIGSTILPVMDVMGWLFPLPAMHCWPDYGNLGWPESGL